MSDLVINHEEAMQLACLHRETSNLGRCYIEQRARIEALEAENENLEIEVAAAKQFGGGFYGEHVSEDTRDWYRGGARAALKQD